ncbi:MAG: hypothetical protein JWQ73_3047 [Variovorax sp.]|nr:hypothetical protein [Variovorax sp.]
MAALLRKNAAPFALEKVAARGAQVHIGQVLLRKVLGH